VIEHFRLPSPLCIRPIEHASKRGLENYNSADLFPTHTEFSLTIFFVRLGCTKSGSVSIQWVKFATIITKTK